MLIKISFPVCGFVLVGLNEIIIIMVIIIAIDQ